jgi:regulator of replication initiation timing
VRGLARRLRSNFGIRSTRMTIRSQMAWYTRWALNALVMVAVAGAVWWLVENSYRITGFNREEAKQQIASLGEENARLKREVEAAKATLGERERQAAIDKASQTELARNVTQLQDENATLKEDLQFLRNIMSSGTTPEGLGIANLKVEPDGQPHEFRYRMLLTQGGQRKQDFKGRVQVVARVAHQGGITSLTFPEASAGEGAGAVDFRFYQKVDGRFRIPEGAVLKSFEVRVLAIPGGQVKLSRTLNLS